MTNTNEKMTDDEWVDHIDYFSEDTPLIEMQEHLWKASFMSRQTDDYNYLSGFIAGIERCQRRAGRQIIINKDFSDNGLLDLKKDGQWREDFPFLL